MFTKAVYNLGGMLIHVMAGVITGSAPHAALDIDWKGCVGADGSAILVSFHAIY